MKKRLATIVAGAACTAAIVGGMSYGLGSPRHEAHCAALHARAATYQQAANDTTDPNLKARYQNQADTLEHRAEQCDARPTTTSSSTSSTAP